MNFRNLFFLVLIGAGACTPKETLAIKYGDVGDFSLPAITGEKETVLTKKSLLGKIWIADFIFTSCSGECPALTENVVKLQRELPGEVSFLSFSVDPDHDSLRELKKYAKRFNAEENRWFFLTGKKEDVYRTIEKGFQLATTGDGSVPISQRFFHSTKLVLIDSRGEIRGYYDGDNVYGITKIKKDALKLIHSRKAPFVADAI